MGSDLLLLAAGIRLAVLWAALGADAPGLPLTGLAGARPINYVPVQLPHHASIRALDKRGGQAWCLAAERQVIGCRHDKHGALDVCPHLSPARMPLLLPRPPRPRGVFIGRCCWAVCAVRLRGVCMAAGASLPPRRRGGIDTPPRGVAICLPRGGSSHVGPFPEKACRACGRFTSGSVAGVVGLLLPLPPRGVAEPRPVRGVGGVLPAVGGRSGGGGFSRRPGGVDWVLVVLREVTSPFGGDAPGGSACFRGCSAAKLRACSAFDGSPPWGWRELLAPADVLVLWRRPPMLGSLRSDRGCGRPCT